MEFQATITLSSCEPVEQAFQTHLKQLRAVSNLPPRGAILYHTIDLNQHQLQQSFSVTFPGVAMSGSSSALGIGFAGKLLRQKSIGILWLLGKNLKIGSGFTAKEDDISQSGRIAIENSLAASGLSKSNINFLLFNSTPGGEEESLTAITQNLASTVALIGGTAADNDLSGKWSTLSDKGSGRDAISLLSGRWPGRIHSRFRSGYTASRKKGIATRTSRRTILEIDGRPAADVYNEWLDGKLDPYLNGQDTILSTTSLHPLGVPRQEALGLVSHILIHPERVTPERGLSTFAIVREGEEVNLMTTFRKALIERGRRTAQMVVERADKGQLDAGLMIYCAGCMFTIENDVEEMLRQTSDVCGDLPLLIIFTFGEQGSLFPGQNDHANLMNGIIIFGH